MSDADHQRWEAIVEREVLGQAIDAEDVAFRAQHEREHGECRSETAAWEQMLDVLREEGEAEGSDRIEALGQRVLVQRDMQRDAGSGVVRPLRPASGPKVGRAVIIASLAAAAAAAAIVITSGEDQPETAHVDRPAPPVVPDEPVPAPSPIETARTDRPVGLLALAGEGLLVDGGAAVAGAEIRPGQRLDFGEHRETQGADGCVVHESPWITTCFSRASEVEFDSTALGQHVELRRGRMMVSLDALPPGQSFSVLTSKGSIAAVGTSFEVWIDEQGTVRASVLEGIVEIRDGDEPRSLLAGQTTLLGESNVGRFGPDALAWSRAHAQLAELWRGADRGVLMVRGRETEDRPLAITLDALPVGQAPVSLLAPQGTHLVAMVGTPEGLPIDIEAGDVHDVTFESDPERPAPKSARPTVSELVRKAGQARGAHRYKDAARYLEKVLEYYPDGPDAQNARVELADLSLEKLGRAGRALELFDAYLRRGGPLTPEARYGRVRALQRLDRPRDERAAIETFLAKHPRDWRSRELEQRLEALD